MCACDCVCVVSFPSLLTSSFPRHSQHEALEGQRSAECDAVLDSPRGGDGKSLFHTTEGDQVKAHRAWYAASEESEFEASLLALKSC